MIVEVLEEETVRVVEIRREDDDEPEAKEEEQQQRQQQQQQQQQQQPTTYHYPIYNERNRDEPEFRLGSNITSLQEENTIICFLIQVHPSERYVLRPGRRLPSPPASLLPWGRSGQGSWKGRLSPEPATTKTAATAAAAGFLRLWRRWRAKLLSYLLFLPPCEPGRPLRLRLRHEGRGQEGLHLVFLLLLLFRRGSVHLHVLARGLRRGGRRAGNYF